MMKRALQHEAWPRELCTHVYAGYIEFCTQLY